MAPTFGVNLRVTGHCNQGSRRHMEDMFSVAYQQTEDELDLEYAYFGIFDGHGGHEAATFAKEHLMKAIVSQPGFWSDNDKDVLRAIKDGFIATHYAMWRNLENWPKTQSGWPSTSGTTASIAFIRRSNIYIGHVGDSCIVLGYQDPCSEHWRGAPLTQDHKPENPAEFERIHQAGGMVVQKSGVPRVVWHRPRLSHKGPLTRSTHIDQIPFLAVARSLGDLWSYNADSDRFIVSPEPDVSVHHIDLSRDRCLIFGTDGLWNMLTPDEAVAIVRKAEFNNKNNGNDGQEQVWLNPSKCLVDKALNKWMEFELRADNTSAVTLLLHPLGPPHSQVLNQQNAVTNLQSEFVPYHIESYKVNEGKSPHKLHSQSSGLAICTWYPHRSLSENLKGDETTTLTAMEELFGKKVEIFDSKKGDVVVNECKEEENKEEECIKPNSSKVKVLLPTTFVYNDTQKESDSKKLPPLYSTILKNPNRTTQNVSEKPKCLEINEKSVQECTKITTDDSESKNGDHSEEMTIDDNDSQEVDEGVSRMKLRGNVAGKVTEQKTGDNSEVGSVPKNYLKTPSFPVTGIKSNGKRGRKRENYSVIESQFDLVNDGKSLRSKSRRRHSSLFEAMNLMYEPKPKHRTRSRDQKKLYDNEEYRSDTENKLDEETNKSRKMTKNKPGESCKNSSTAGNETMRQNHLQERLQLNCNNSNNSNSNSSHTAGECVGSTNNGNSSSQGSNAGSGNSQEFTPMRLRSNMPVKTLRSRNINLEICDWFFLGLTKYNNVGASKRSMGKQQTCKAEDTCEGSKSLTKLNSLARSSVNSGKIHMSDSTYRSAVHTRSQNKRLKK
ncbi:hypothetical protein RUM43_010929 [Polyplax serrata]|uniref:PPM-type phosphatase domain-containing protein n=1 Tax=Polyplax serrata TaxID=468196 RepID=A0AAN8NSP5_POLSC